MKWAANLTKEFFQNSFYKISPYFEEKLSEVATFRDCIYEGFEKKNCNSPGSDNSDPI